MIFNPLKALASTKHVNLPVAVALAVVLLNVLIGETLPQTILDLRQQMGLTNEQANLVRLLPATAGLLVAPSAGQITDLLGSKRLLNLSLAAVCCGCFVFAVSNSINLLIVGLLLAGLGQAATTVTGYTMLTKTASNSKQLGLFIAAWGITANIGYLLFPRLGTFVLVNSERGWTNIRLIWLAAHLCLLVTSQLKLRDDIAEEGTKEQNETDLSRKNRPIDWGWPITGGLIFSLTTAIPVVNALNQNLTGALIFADAIAIALLCRLIKHSKQTQLALKFLKNPAITLGLLALAGCYLVDRNYYMERFISLRYLLNLNQASAWLSPADFAGLVGASLFGIVNLRLGLTRTTAAGLAASFLVALSFLFSTQTTPIWA